MLLLACNSYESRPSQMVLRLIEDTPANRKHITKLDELSGKLANASAKHEKSVEAGHKPATQAKHLASKEAVQAEIKALSKFIPDGQVYTDRRFYVYPKGTQNLSQAKQDVVFQTAYKDFVNLLAPFAGDSADDFRNKCGLAVKTYLEDYNLTTSFLTESFTKFAKALRASTIPVTLECRDDLGNGWFNVAIVKPFKEKSATKGRSAYKFGRNV